MTDHELTEFSSRLCAASSAWIIVTFVRRFGFAKGLSIFGSPNTVRKTSPSLAMYAFEELAFAHRSVFLPLQRFDSVQVDHRLPSVRRDSLATF